MKHTKNWKIGDELEIIENGVRLTGKIVKIDNGYHVEWSDGETTIEDNPSPAVFKNITIEKQETL